MLNRLKKRHLSRGFTTMELVVVLGLTAIVGSVIFIGSVQMLSTTTRAISNSIIEERLNNNLRTLTHYVDSAVALGACLNSYERGTNLFSVDRVYSQKDLADCPVPGQRPFSLAINIDNINNPTTIPTATPTSLRADANNQSMCFYSYSDPAVDRATTPPSQVCIRTQPFIKNGHVMKDGAGKEIHALGIDVYLPQVTATYTTPSWQTQPSDSKMLGYLSITPGSTEEKILTYYDKNNNELLPTAYSVANGANTVTGTGLTYEQSKNVTLVKLSTTLRTGPTKTQKSVRQLDTNLFLNLNKGTAS